MLHPESGFLIHTNHYCTERFKDGEIAPAMLPCSHSRLQRLKAWINDNYGHITANSIQKLFSDHTDSLICRHADRKQPNATWTETIGSIIMPSLGGHFAYLHWTAL